MRKLIIFALVMLLLSSICNGQGVTPFGATSANNFSKTLGKLWVTTLSGGGDTSILWVNDSGVVRRIPINIFRQIINIADTGYVKYTDTPSILSPYLRKYAPITNITVADVHATGNLEVEGDFSLTGAALFLDGMTDAALPVQENSIMTVGNTGIFGKSTISTNDVLVWADTVGTPGIATQYDISQIPIIDTTSLSNRINARVKYTDSGTIYVTPFGLTPYVRKQDSVGGGYYPYSTNPKGYLTSSTVPISNGSIQKSAAQTTTAPTQSAVKRYTDLAASTQVSFPATPYVWWIADTPWVVLTSGLIDTLRDASGNNRTAWQTTTLNKPTFNASGGMGNNAYAYFNSSSPSKMSSSTITLDTTFTFFFVYKFNESVSGSGEFLLGSSSNTNFTIGNNFATLFYTSTGPQLTGVSGGLFDFCIIEVQRKGRVSKVSLNGAPAGEISNLATTAPFNWSGIGGNIGSGSQFSEFQFYELIAYNSVLTEEQMQNVRNYLYGKYGGRYGTFFAIGDSWTSGTLAGQYDGTKWSARTATALGFSSYNEGIAGTTLMNASPTVTNNGYSRLTRMPHVPVSGLGYVGFMYGGNDANSGNPSINLTNYNPVLFRFQMSKMINQLIDYGWKREQIVICTQGKFNGAQRARWDSFMTAELQVARQMNVKSLDLNTFFGDNIANNGSIGGDGTHPTPSQGDTISRLLQSVIFTDYVLSGADTTSASIYYPVPRQRPAVFIGSTSTWTIPPVLDNKGYSIQINNAGSGNITVNTYSGNELFTTVATNTLTIAAGDSYILFNTGTYWKTEKLAP